MIERILLIFWGAWLLFVLIAALRVIGFSIARRGQERKWADVTRNQRPAAVIVAAKGFDPRSTPRFFDTLFAQAYSSYRVIVCFESWQDPVAVWLREELEVREDSPVWTHPESDAKLSSITLVCAGIASQEGQKVHNQIAAFGQLEDRDEVIAFIDADVIFPDDWLARLSAPINLKTHPLSTTYRWLVPKRPTLPNQIASVINGSITTQGGSEMTNVLWGGSMAIARSVFDKLEIAKLFSGSLNDDLRLSKAARRSGNRIAFVRSLILPTITDFTWSSFFEFAKRQYTQVKFFSPILYTGANIALGFYALGLVTLVAALIYGYFYAWIPIAAAYVIDQIRALARQQVYLNLFEENGIRQKLFAAGWLEHMLTPFWMLMHWLIIVSTWTQSRITWAGIRYRIHSKSKTQILDRPTVAERLPSGVAGLALIAGLHDKKRRTYTRPIQPTLVSESEAVEENTPKVIAETVSEPEVAHETPKEETLEPALQVETAATGDSGKAGLVEFGSIDAPDKERKITSGTSGTKPAAIAPGHPGISKQVILLASAPMHGELRAARAAGRKKRLYRQSADRVAAAKTKTSHFRSKRYPVRESGAESSPPPEERKITSGTKPAAIAPGYPGILNRVILLASAPMHGEPRAARAAGRKKRLYRQSADRVAAAKTKTSHFRSKRYPVRESGAESSPPTEERKITSGTKPAAIATGHPGISKRVILLASAPMHGELRAARAAGRKKRLYRQSADRVAAAKTKTSYFRSKRYPVRKSGVELSPPTGKFLPISPKASAPDSVPEKILISTSSSSNGSRSNAAHRPGSLAGYHSGTASKRAPLSSRAEQSSRASRSPAVPRPVSKRVSGRR